MNILKPVFRLLSPPGRRARLSILTFHRVLAAPDPLFPDVPDATSFDEVLDWCEQCFNVLPLDRAVNDLVAGTLPSRAAAITFDDGYADNAAVALPLLLKRHLTATFFITTGFLDGGRMWNDTLIEAVRECPATTLDLSAMNLGTHVLASAADRRTAIDALIAKMKYLPDAERVAATERVAAIAGVEPPTDLMMTSQNIRDLRHAGMQVGAHTMSHCILAGLEKDAARREIVGSKAHLESIVGGPITLFAYPNGKLGQDYTVEHAELAHNAGFRAAVTTDWGAATASTPLMQLPRFTPWDRTRLRFSARLAMNLLR